jgi:hypothetical protein
MGTNRDLAAMQGFLDREILRLKRLASGGTEPGLLDRRFASLCRQRIAVCAALVNRRIEASNKVVIFSRWVSGNGALGDADTGANRQTMPLGEGWRSQSPLKNVKRSHTEQGHRRAIARHRIDLDQSDSAYPRFAPTYQLFFYASGQRPNEGDSGIARIRLS